MAIRTSIFDRYYEQRLAREALEREKAEHAAAEAAAFALLPVEVPITPMVDSPSSFDFGGFKFAFPESFSFHDIEATLDHEGHRVAVSVQRRKASELLSLANAFDTAVLELRQRFPLLRVVRQRDCLLAGSAALALDYHFMSGLDERHGRLVVGLVPLSGASARQVLSIGCVVDPRIEALTAWLLAFDQMLDGLAAN